MNYTIALLEEVHTGFTVDYGVNGNMKYITIYDKETGIIRSRNFKNASEAIWVFEKLSEAVCNGLYDFDGRVALLMTENTPYI